MDDEFRKLSSTTYKTLRRILEKDDNFPKLSDDTNLTELEAQIDLFRGQAIKIYIDRNNLPSLTAILPGSHATVADLKKSIRLAYEFEEKQAVFNKVKGHSDDSKSRNKQQHSDNRKNECSYRDTALRKLKFSSNLMKTKISWRYIWRTYMLKYKDQLLSESGQSLSSYGVSNKSVIKFVKKPKMKINRR